MVFCTANLIIYCQLVKHIANVFSTKNHHPSFFKPKFNPFRHESNINFYICQKWGFLSCCLNFFYKIAKYEHVMQNNSPIICFSHYFLLILEKN